MQVDYEAVTRCNYDLSAATAAVPHIGPFALHHVPRHDTIADVGGSAAALARSRLPCAPAWSHAMTADPLQHARDVDVDDSHCPGAEERRCWRLAARCPVPRAVPNFAMKKGTTTLGMLFDGGIIIAVDSRASTGQYIASQTVMKVLEINDYLLGTMAGGAADCQYWERVLGIECRLWELRHGTRITVAAASKILANITYSYRNYGLSMGTMIAGWDRFGPSLYYVDDKGTRLKQDVFSVGSGSIYAYGVLDAGYRKDLTVDDACELARRAIFHATYRDGASGGIVTVYHVHDKGWTRISRDDQTLLFDRYCPGEAATHGATTATNSNNNNDNRQPAPSSPQQQQDEEHE